MLGRHSHFHLNTSLGRAQHLLLVYAVAVVLCTPAAVSFCEGELIHAAAVHMLHGSVAVCLTGKALHAWGYHGQKET